MSATEGMGIASSVTPRNDGNVGKAWLNVLLIVISVAVLLAATLIADRVVGRVLVTPKPSGTMQLIFPPGSDQAFQTVSYHYHAKVNSLGLREREFKPEKTKKYRIVAIGDSYTYGWGVEAEQTWLRLVEDKLNKDGYDVETINCGKPGADPPFYADLAEKVVPLFQPDLVLVCILQGNDLAGSGPEGLKPAKTWIVRAMHKLYPNTLDYIERRALDKNKEKSQGIEQAWIGNEEDNRRQWAAMAKKFVGEMKPEEKARYDKFDSAMKDIYLRGDMNPYQIDLALKTPKFYTFTMDLNDPWAKTLMERMGGHLERIRETAERQGSKLLVLSMPHGAYVNVYSHETIARTGYEMQPDMLTSDAPDKATKTACDMAGVPMLEVTQGFRAKKDDGSLYFDLDEHMTAAGHQLFADLITPLLEKEIGPKGGRQYASSRD